MDEEEFQAMLRYQNMMSRQVLQESKTDSKIKVLTVINDLAVSKKRIQTHAILVEAEHRGMIENDVYSILDELVSDGLIEEKDGYIKKL